MASHSFNDRTNMPASLKSFITRAHHNNNRSTKIDFIVELITQKNTNHSNMINVYSATTTEDKHTKKTLKHTQFHQFSSSCFFLINAMINAPSRMMNALFLYVFLINTKTLFFSSFFSSFLS